MQTAPFTTTSPFYPKRKPDAFAVVALMERHREEIVRIWAERTYRMVAYYDYKLTAEEWRVGSYPFLDVMIEGLLTGSYTHLDNMLAQTSRTWNNRELDIGEFLSPMLEFTELVRSVVLDAETIDLDLFVELNNQLERCVNHIVTVYASLYTAEANRKLAREQARVSLVLNVLEAVDDDMDEKSILCAISESIAFEMGRQHYLCLSVKVDHGVLTDPLVCAHFPDTAPVSTFQSPLTKIIVSRFKESSEWFDLDSWYWRNEQDASQMDGSHSGETWLRAALLIPLQIREHLMAIVAVASFSPDLDRPFSQPEINLARSLAQSANQALQNLDIQRKIRQKAITEERERLAQEFHDEQAQILGTVNWRLATIDRLLSTNQVDAARASLKELDHIVAGGYKDVREAIVLLRIASSLDVDFLNTLRGVINQYRELHSELIVEEEVCACPGSGISAPTQLQIIRIVQEALANVWQHAGATRVRIGLQREGNQLILAIVDDGCGFDSAQSGPMGEKHFGLSIMAKRAKSAGGILEIHSSPGKGTQVTFRLAMSEENWRN